MRLGGVRWRWHLTPRTSFLSSLVLFWSPTLWSILKRLRSGNASTMWFLPGSLTQSPKTLFRALPLQIPLLLCGPIWRSNSRRRMLHEFSSWRRIFPTFLNVICLWLNISQNWSLWLEDVYKLFIHFNKLNSLLFSPTFDSNTSVCVLAGGMSPSGSRIGSQQGGFVTWSQFLCIFLISDTEWRVRDV